MILMITILIILRNNNNNNSNNNNNYYYYYNDNNSNIIKMSPATYRLGPACHRLSEHFSLTARSSFNAQCYPFISDWTGGKNEH